MKIRNYTPSDCPALAQLFYESVHIVCAKDYTQPQLDAWATREVDLAQWNKSFLRNTTLVAEKDGIICGFADMDSTGYLDRLYVHKDYQGIGIGTKLVAALEESAKKYGVKSFHTFASITAKPFFEKMGYTNTGENIVHKNGIKLTNFKMVKKHERKSEGV